MFRPRETFRPFAGAALVVALHAAVLMLLPAPTPDPDPPLPSVAPTVLWLLPTPPADPPPDPPAAARDRATAVPARSRAATAATAARAQSPVAPPAERELQAITLPAPQAPAGPHPAPAAAASASQPPALNLALPRAASAPWRTRHPALDDARFERGRRGLEVAIAQALGGDDRIVEERLDADRVRVRSGSRCVVLKRSRAGQLDLAGGAFRELWAASEC